MDPVGLSYEDTVVRQILGILYIKKIKEHYDRTEKHRWRLSGRTS